MAGVERVDMIDVVEKKKDGGEMIAVVFESNRPAWIRRSMAQNL